MKIEGKLITKVERNGKITKYYLENINLLKDKEVKKGIFGKKEIVVEKVPLGNGYLKIEEQK